ncbi:MAG: GGDEF domain-containing protein [Treponema sp.]|nr:GGDEF domain-containing protein [Treponema sp.]
MENKILADLFLSKLALFSRLNENEFNYISDYLKIINVKKGESVFREGDTGKEMYTLFSGSLSAFGVQSDGTERKLFDVKLGNFFGEMSIITHEPRSVTITAMEDSVFIILAEVDFYRIISQHPEIGYKILQAISIVQNQWLNQTSKSFSDLIRWGESARKRAITDEMTGLHNRSFLEESIRERINNQSLNLRIMSLLMMDLDKIHSINDLYGTKAGDLVIISAADVISSCLRKGDIPSRLSGDEFAVLLPDTDIEHAQAVAEIIRTGIEEKSIKVPANSGSSENITISTRASIGISIMPLHAKTTEEFLETSDQALRRAKELGRNRVEVFH